MMSMFMALSALTIALGALWFTSELVRRNEAGGKLEVKPHVVPIQEALRRAEAKIHQLTRGLESAERQIALLKAENREYEAEIGLAPPVHEPNPLAVELAKAGPVKNEAEQRFEPSETQLEKIKNSA